MAITSDVVELKCVHTDYRMRVRGFNTLEGKGRIAFLLPPRDLYATPAQVKEFAEKLLKLAEEWS